MKKVDINKLCNWFDDDGIRACWEQATHKVSGRKLCDTHVPVYKEIMSVGANSVEIKNIKIEEIK